MQVEQEIPKLKVERLGYVLDLAWAIFIEKIVTGRLKINKESSMQLHYSAILNGLGELMCIEPKEIFEIELESVHDKQNIDIICSYGDIKAAVELKCFRKASKRATDTDMYDVLKDIERLLSYEDFQVKRFICLTDNRYYSDSNHSGNAGVVSIKNGKKYSKDVPIKPSWAGKWGNTSRDEPIVFNKDISFNWEMKNCWYFLKMKL